MNTEEYILEIENINHKNWEFLWFDEIVKNNFDELIKKIILTHLSKRFNFEFENNDKYFKEISIFIKQNIFNKNKLSIKDYEELYILIFSAFFKKKELWFRSRIKYNLVWLDENWKKIDFYASYTEINKKLEIIFLKYNNQEKYHLFERMYFITIENLNKIHPFSNNNFWFISIFLDILLIKHNYLPINLKQTFKVNNLFFPNYNIFLQILLERYKNYNY
jgi:hypothetical protein